MGLFDTTANEVAIKRLNEARKGIKDLKELLDHMDEALERRLKEKEQVGFEIDWCSQMMDKAEIIFNEIARCNGALLVRSTA